MINTVVFGPLLNTAAPAFTVLDHEHQRRSLDDLMGTAGLLLGFISDMWMPASVRRILWMQRHAGSFLRVNINPALVICDQPHTVSGYRASSQVPLEFPLLADIDSAVHQRFNMEALSGLVLLDSHRVIRRKWLVPDERVWPNINELLDAAKAM